MKKGKLFTVVKFLLPLLLLIFAVLELKKFIRHLDLGLLQTEIAQLRLGTLLLMFMVLLAAVLPMLLYDVMLMKILGLKARIKEVLEQALIVNTYSNLFGFGGLIGGMLRTYFYHKLEDDKRRLVGGIAAVSFFYLTGMSLLALIVAVGFTNHPIFVQTKWLYFAVLGVSLYLPLFIGIYIFKNRRDKQSLITYEGGIKLFFISVLEWTAVFCGIWFLSWIMNIPVTFEQLFPVYVVATCAGIISMIPGGLGSFDLVFIWGMQYLHVPEEKVLVVLLFYRIGYYLLPFILSTILFFKLYWEKWNQSWSNIPTAIIQNVSHVTVTILVFLSGLILLLSASVPGIMDRLRIAQEILSFPIINISHQLSVAAGFLLLGLSRGIEYSVKRTYELTMLVLILAALFSIFKGIDYEEAIFLITVALLLRMAKGQFYRESYVLTWGKTTLDIVITTVIISMYLVIGYSNLPTAKITIPSQLLPYVIEDSQDLFSSAMIGLVIALLILYVGYVISKPKKWKFETSIEHEREILEHLNTYHGKVLSHLILLHDKYIYWNSKKNVLISFQQYADKLVILGDPIGDRSQLSNAIEEFQDVSDRYGYTPVFYQVSDDLLPYLHGNGYTFFKLGEEAFVELEEFSLTSTRMKELRALQNKFSKENYQFEVIEPPFSTTLFDELRVISDEWLLGRREQGFSLGYFDTDYLNKAPIAVVKNSEGQILGFTSIMPVYDDHTTISVDLMRFRKNSPKGTMDYLLLQLVDWAKVAGYSRFNMGMAPLANVGLSKFSFLSEKIAAQIFLHGNQLYQFQGLRRFKEKYTNKWESKYLGYRRKSKFSLPLTMAQIMLLISKRRM
ncbi:bifunctional lysylphosphatidylglycerol flippase/synthetase MprF [Neobacillus niacini]|uniref:bifunctional lysylphosphatidylglycerol flippase/synthetase MprF n=1 Tax=Neobacillus niacini TaxID=86668 RepID=UPI0005F064CD|nr:bifunctional lysylphosphatidylglycerol flippase/synthetase MprF [Neobacillus niacini]